MITHEKKILKMRILGYRLDREDLNLCKDNSESFDIKVMKVREKAARKSMANNLVAKILTNPYLDLSILNQPIDMMESDFILRGHFSNITTEADDFDYREIEKIRRLYKENENKILMNEYLQIKKEIIKNTEQEDYKESAELLYNFSKKIEAIQNDTEIEDLAELLKASNSSTLELSSTFYEKAGLHDKASETYTKSLQIIGVVK